MKPVWKWLLVSMGGGIVVTVALSTLPERLVDAPEDKPHPAVDKTSEIILWPIAVCVYLSGHGAPIGRWKNKRMRQLPYRLLLLSWGLVSHGSSIQVSCFTSYGVGGIAGVEA